MDDDQQSTTSGYPQVNMPVKKKRNVFVTLTLIIVGVLLLGGAAYGGYMYGTDNVDDTSKVSTKATDAAANFHTVVSEGYPIDGDSKVVTKLGIPNQIQAIAIASDIQDTGYTEILANDFNSEMGRWILGNPALAGAGSQPGELSIINISDDWLKGTTEITDTSGGTTINGYEFTTQAKKAASLKKLETDTKQCATDSEKGFTISDILNVCYTASHVRQSPGAYSPILDLNGYGVVDGKKYVLFGYIILVDRVHSEADADKLADAFDAGNTPSETKSLIADYVNALKQSTISSNKR